MLHLRADKMMTYQSRQMTVFLIKT